MPNELKEYWESLTKEAKLVYALQSEVNCRVNENCNEAKELTGSDSLDAACIAYLTARGLTVVDPAKCMVLERREGELPRGYYLGVYRGRYRWITSTEKCYDIQNLNSSGFSAFTPHDVAIKEFPCDAIFKIPTEAR